MVKLVLISAVTTAVLTGLWLYFSKRLYWFDRDDHQIKKRKVIPTSGGIAIFVGFWLIIFLYLGDLILSRQYLGIYFASLVVLVTGLLDDRFELTPLQKTSGLFIASNVVFFVSNVTFSTTLLPNASPYVYQLLQYLFTIGWLLLVSNAINLIDGLDGLATSTMIISLLALVTITLNFSLSIQFVLTVMLLVLLGTLIGFLPFNWAPAKIYLGDTGALFIGFMYGVLTVTQLKNASFYSLILPMLLYAVPIFDTVFAVIRRMLKRQKITQGDNQHIHHRLMHLGLKEWQVVVLMIIITTAFSGLAILTQLFKQWRQVILLIIILLLVGLLVWMLYASYKQQRETCESKDERKKDNNEEIQQEVQQENHIEIQDENK